MYIACMHISPIHITISFLPAELQRRDALTPNDITGAGHALFVRCLSAWPASMWLVLGSVCSRQTRGLSSHSMRPTCDGH